jgi:hypothetical protein
MLRHEVLLRLGNKLLKWGIEERAVKGYEGFKKRFYSLFKVKS